MSRFRVLTLLALAAVAVAVAAALVWGPVSRTPTFTATDLGPGIPAADFTLLSGDSVRVSLDDFRGRVVLLFFGYTTCPDVCPLTLAKLRTVMEELGGERDDVEVVVVSVDPEVDTPDRIHDYARGFDPSFVGLSGSEDALRAVAREYGVYASEASAPAVRLEGHEDHGDDRAHGLPPRVIAHSSYVFGITRNGEMRLLWSGEAPAQAMADDVRTLLGLQS